MTFEGGISAGINIFNMAILPVLTYNSSTWFEMNKKTLQKLEKLQCILQRCLLRASNSTPLLAMSWDLGMLSVEELINKNKLMFLHYIVEQDDSNLSKEIFLIQKSLNFPGFVHEARNLIRKYGLPNIIDENLHFSKFTWKAKVKKAINEHYQNDIKQKIKKSSKLKDGPINDEKFELQGYIRNMTLNDARTNFKLRSNTFKAKMNQKSNPIYSAKLWKCGECQNLDTQSHIMWCPGYAPLREGLDIDNDVDVVHYFQQVFKLRESLDSE